MARLRKPLTNQPSRFRAVLLIAVAVGAFPLWYGIDGAVWRIAPRAFRQCEAVVWRSPEGRFEVAHIAYTDAYPRERLAPPKSFDDETAVLIELSVRSDGYTDPLQPTRAAQAAVLPLSAHWTTRIRLEMSPAWLVIYNPQSRRLRDRIREETSDKWLEPAAAYSAAFADHLHTCDKLTTPPRGQSADSVTPPAPADWIATEIWQRAILGADALAELSDPPRPGLTHDEVVWPTLAWWTTRLVLALVSFTAGAWAIRLLVRTPRCVGPSPPWCPRCGYALDPAMPRCPECGTGIRWAGAP